MKKLEMVEKYPPAHGRTKAILVLAVLVFSVISWCAHGGLRTPAFDVDSFDYAQMARQVYRGEGFTMLQTFPYVQRYLIEHGHPAEPPWPNTTRFPLIALEEAAAFFVTGPNDVGILLTGGAMFVATAVVVFLLGNSLFGPWGALLAVLALATDTRQLQFSRSGLLETGAGFFLVLAALALVRSTDGTEKRKRWVFFTGNVVGLAFLQRYDLLAIAPVAAALLVLRLPSHRGESLLLFAAGSLATAGPWIVRNFLTIGTLLGSTSVDRNLLAGVISNDVYMGTQILKPWAVALANWPALVAKYELGARWMIEHAHELLGGTLATTAGLLTLTIPLTVRERAARTVALFLVGAFAARAVLLTLMHNEVRFYLSYTPLVLVLAAGVMVSLIRRLPGRFNAIEAALVPAALGLALLQLPALPWGSAPPVPPTIFASLRDRVAPQFLVASDNSWHVAWYSERPSIRFSGKWTELVNIEEAGVRVEAVLMRGPSGLAFDAAHQQAGGDFFLPREEFRDGYRLWFRRNDSPPLNGS